MTFLYLCAFIVIALAIIIGSMLFGMLTLWTTDSEEWVVAAWAICAVGFAVCLTYVLHKTGVI